ncbi:MAG TPA: hypothetical protein VG077_04920 [Verrucomicrobiae bacterium]|nr:hypothetical protein [Verrucomicrobiae bacterium]
MSLINDALKQVKQSRPQNPPANSPPLPPAEPAAAGNGNWLAPVMSILLVAAAGIFIGLSLSKQAPAMASVPLAAAATNRPVNAVATTRPLVANSPPGSNRVVRIPPKPPEPKLQGILFDAARPCAIVSGRTVFIGDRVGEFRVTAISKDDLTMQSETETRVLSLSRQ